MSVNRYRLKHLARHGNTSAKQVNILLERPDRLLGLVLLCDTFADISASAIGTVLAVHYFGGIGVMISTIIITFVILVLGELAPKTLAALYPTKIVLLSAWPLRLLLKLIYPLVWFVNFLSNGFLYLLGLRSHQKKLENFTIDELRTIVSEASHHIPVNDQNMLLQLLNLEKIYIEDIMTPVSSIMGIDLDKPWEEILDQLTINQHTRLPVYTENINAITGILHVRQAINLLAQKTLDKTSLLTILEKPYFIPENTLLNHQLVQFSDQKIRMGLVVDEYGDIQGLVTIDDILEEIVGEFTTNTADMTQKDIHPDKNGCYILDGGFNLRTLNKTLHTHFPITQTGPKTLSGLIIEHLEIIPPSNSCVKIAGYALEILSIKDNTIKTVRIKI